MHDRMILKARNAAVRAGRMPPVRARHERPPSGEVVERHRGIGPLEHRRSGQRQIGGEAGVELGFGRQLGQRAIPGRRDEGGEPRVGDGVTLMRNAATRTMRHGAS
jgi:hypothetical protein